MDVLCWVLNKDRLGQEDTERLVRTAFQVSRNPTDGLMSETRLPNRDALVTFFRYLR